MYETARNMGAGARIPNRASVPRHSYKPRWSWKIFRPNFFLTQSPNRHSLPHALCDRIETLQTNSIAIMASSKKVVKTSRDKKQPTSSKVAGGRIEKSKKTAAKRSDAPGPLLNLVQSFLSEHGYTEAASKLQAETNTSATAAAPKDLPNLTTLYEQWEKTAKDTPEAMDVDDKSAASSDDSSDSSSASDSDSSDDSSDSDDDNAPKKAAARDVDSDSSSSSSDSSSDSDSDSDSEDEQAKPKRATSVASSSASSSSSSSDSDSSSDDDDAAKVPLPESDSSSSSSSSDSSDSDSSSESESEAEAKNKKSKVPAKKGKKAASVSSSSSSSSSSSDSSSDSDSSSSESESDAVAVKKTSKKAAAKDSDSSSSSSDSSSSESESSDSEKEDKESKSDSSRTVGPASPPAPTSDNKRKHAGSPGEDGQPKKKNHVENRFQRVKPDYYVDPKFASNEYVSYDYADRAHADLIVTKGKGFTKEKNKKKRGSYRGGMIDTSGGKGIKFDD